MKKIFEIPELDVRKIESEEVMAYGDNELSRD